METTGSAKLSAKQRVDAYYSEIARRRLFTALSALAVIIFTACFITLLTSDKFDYYLSYVGLQELSKKSVGGVYADCSLPENEGISYCRAKKDQQQKNWENITRGGGGGGPFTLHSPE